MESRYGAVYAPNAANTHTGYLLFMQGSNLMAQAFDPEALALKGEPEFVAADVGGSESNAYIDVSTSRTGLLAYGTVRQIPGRLFWFDRAGRKSEAVSDSGLWGEVRISPDGRSVSAPRTQAGRTDVWVIDIARGSQQKLTLTGDLSVNAVWSPDGQQIAYARPGKACFSVPAMARASPWRS